ncbi:MAG: hypothetical protein NT010_13040 [Proteobacteria bacterium]|nr:hypothetical protein [Pseudomonadota bacterium]
MKFKYVKAIILALVLIFGFTMPIQAATIVDLNSNDWNSISGYGYVPGTNYFTVTEDYNEYRQIIPYPSHDGYALVDPYGGFFDKKITLGPGEGSNFNMTFIVTNTTPYTWSDYHFIIKPQGVEYVYTGANSDHFVGWSFRDNGGIDNELQFFPYFIPPWPRESVHPGETVTFNFSVNAPYGSEFYLTQIATTSVPIPGAIWLLAPGFLGLMGLKKKYL